MDYDDEDMHFDDIPDEAFEGFAPENLCDAEWKKIKELAKARLHKDCAGNYAKACVLSYFDYLDIVTEMEIKHQ